MVEDQKVQVRTIVSALRVRTREGKVEWAWDKNLERGTTTLVNGRVIVSKDRDFDTVIQIQDTDSNILGEINVGYPAFGDLSKEADELYELARRSALQVDSKLESILREISG